MTKHTPPMSGLHFVGEDNDGNPIWSGTPPSAGEFETAPPLSSEPKPTIRVSCSHSLLPETLQLLSPIGRHDRGGA